MKPNNHVYEEKYDFTILVLQGGGALGAYQAGVYEGLVAAGISPDWITGVSIGGINAALIAGNAPEQRVRRLRDFWTAVSSGALGALPGLEHPFVDPLRNTLSRVSAAASATLGVPGFFSPRVPPPVLMPSGSDAALSVYDTAPLRSTLEELVDFELINRRDVRLSLGAVNIQTGNSTYFDSHQIHIRPEHVLASGALPPAFAPVEIDGQAYWDGGIVSNTPLWYVLDNSPPMKALIIQVDLFSAKGERPRDLDQVMERHKDIMYSSRTRFNTTRVRELQQLRSPLHRLLRKLPEKLARDPDAQALEKLCSATHIDIVHLINRHSANASFWKDYDFARATMRRLWDAGLTDVRRSVAHPEWLKRSRVSNGIEVYDLTREDVRVDAESREYLS
jgi:NTE family protein